MSSLRNVAAILALVALVLAPSSLTAQEDTGLDLGAIAARQAAPTRLRLHDGRRGEALFRASGAGRCRVTLRCSTREGARLSVGTRDGDGKTTKEILWSRRDDRDPSPMQVDGQERSDSIFQRSPGDYSPRATEEAFDVAKDMEIRIALANEGGGTPELLFVCDAPGKLSGDVTEKDEGDGGSAEGTAEGGDAATIELDPAKSWTLDVNGTVTSTSGFARLVRGNGSVHGRGLDVFTSHGAGLNVRLANRAVRFLEARVGRINNPGGDKDHWLRCDVGRIRRGERVSLRIENDATARRLRIWWGDALVGDVTYERRGAAGRTRGLVLENLDGTAELAED